MQGWEGEMDTVHAAFLHFGSAKPEDQQPGSFNFYQANQRHAKFSVIETDFGTSYGAYRPAGPDTYYWRIAHMLFPFYAMIPQGAIGNDAKIGAYVPMDDEHTLHWEIFIRPDILGGPGVPPRPEATRTPTPRPGQLANTTDWYGRFNIEQNLANDYLIDREAQRSNVSFSGIPGVRQQDMAVTESMGPIYKRYNEHLGTTDAMIIRTRRRLIQAAKALRDNGTIPPGVDDPKVYRQRSGEVILPRSVDWWEATRDARARFDATDVKLPVFA
jgi:hypothetical protein